MKMNIKGAIDLMLTATLSTVLVVGGFVIWRIQDSDSTVSPSKTTISATTPPQTAEELEANIPEGWTKFTNEALGFSFQHPEDWTIESQFSADDESDRIIFSLNLQSPDYAASTEEGGGTASGALVNVRIDSIKNSGVAHSNVSNIVDGTYENKAVFSSRTALETMDIDGVEYISTYEGPRYLTSQFDSGDMAIYFFLEEDTNDLDFNIFEAEYRQIVDSLSI